jgi:WD40 repeat protein
MFRSLAALLLPLVVASLDCDHGELASTGVDCNCFSAWSAYAPHKDHIAFHTNGMIQIQRWICSLPPANDFYSVYRTATDAKPAPGDYGDCTLDNAAVFTAPTANADGAMPVAEFVSLEDHKSRYYGIGLTAQPGWEMAIQGVFYAFPSADNDTNPVYRLELEAETHLGTTVDNTLTTDETDFKSCSFWLRTVQADELVAAINSIADASLERMRTEWADKNPLTNPDTPLSVAVGGGVDSTLGRITKFPVLKMNYMYEPAPEDYFGTFLSPKEVTLAQTVSPKVVDETHVFDHPWAYVEHITKMAADNTGVVGIYEREEWKAINDDFFNIQSSQGSLANSMSVLQGSYALMKAEIDTKDTDPFFDRALLSLPPDLAGENEKKMLGAFIDTFGTAVVTEGVYGGMMMQTSLFPSSLDSIYTGAGLKFSKAQLAEFAGEEFTDSTGFGGHNGNTMPKEYNTVRSFSERVCYGGDPLLAMNCFGSTNATRDWLDTILASPFPLGFTFEPLTIFIKNADVRAVVFEAIKDRNYETMDEWAEVDTCTSCVYERCINYDLTGAGPDDGIAFPCVERCRETIDQKKMHGYTTTVSEKMNRNVNDMLWLPSTDGGAPLLVSASGDKMVRVHDVSTGSLVSEFETDCSCRAHSLGLVDEGKTLLVGVNNGNVEVWDAINGQFKAKLTSMNNILHDMVVMDDGKTFAGVSATVKVWQYNTTELIPSNDGTFKTSFSTGDDSLKAIAALNNGKDNNGAVLDGNFIVVGGSSNRVKVYREVDPDLGVASEFEYEQMRNLEGHSKTVTALHIMADRDTIVSGDNGGELIFWSLLTGLEIHRIKNAHTARVASFTEYNGTLVSVADDGLVKWWDAETFICSRTFFFTDGGDGGPDEPKSKVTAVLTMPSELGGGLVFGSTFNPTQAPYLKFGMITWQQVCVDSRCETWK